MPEKQAEVLCSMRTEDAAMSLAADFNRRFSRLAFFLYRKQTVLMETRKELSEDERTYLKALVEGYKLALGH